MTQILLQSSIDKTQTNVLLELFNSWNIDVVITDERKSEKKSNHKLFAKTRGMWKDYDIDAKQLRKDAWGTEKLIQQ